MPDFLTRVYDWAGSVPFIGAALMFLVLVVLIVFVPPRGSEMSPHENFKFWLTEWSQWAIGRMAVLGMLLFLLLVGCLATCAERSSGIVDAFETIGR